MMNIFVLVSSVEIETGSVFHCQFTICTVLLRFCFGYDEYTGLVWSILLSYSLLKLVYTRITSDLCLITVLIHQLKLMLLWLGLSRIQYKWLIVKDCQQNKNKL